MNDKAFENKVNQDVDQAKTDFATLGDDSINGLSRIFEQQADDAKKMVAVAAKNLNEAVGQGLSQYNAKVQEVADRVPGDFSKKAAEYPWVTVTIFLALGLLLGLILKNGRKPVCYFRPGSNRNP